MDSDMREKQRKETMLSTMLLSDTLDHFEEILEVCKMENAPEHAKALLNMEYEILMKAYREMKDDAARYSTHEDACECTLKYAEDTEDEFEEMKEDYEDFAKYGSTAKR